MTEKLKRGEKPYEKIFSPWIWLLKPVLYYKTKAHSILISLEQKCLIKVLQHIWKSNLLLHTMVKIT